MHRFIIIDMIDIEKFISRVRDSFIGSQQVYTEGSCYHFYLILKEIFPNAQPYFDEDHIVTKIDGKFYDITGEVKEVAEKVKKATAKKPATKKPKK